ncbi:gluconokinase [Pseudothermotoga thermarum]|uniref:Carbohydrate kinase, FGGY n=1 Tax=Pseudothermotoga thermarum DSM 5069 TaxID=688269 RepID=F7YYP8_9THEM|nr:gluconokinase [Pseudothermotoga thermarum]AEH51081.1 Carbohydrate kinase, FGGY [Pseudothermotoga thermarum DSM 5069]
MNSVFLGLDIGTTGAKCCAFDEEGNLISLGRQNYGVIQPKAGWVEQDPDEIINAVFDSIKQCLHGLNQTHQVEAIGLSSMFHSTLLVDAQTQKLTNLIIWADTRAAHILKNYQETFWHLYPLTGCVYHEMYPLAKLIWLKLERPDLLEKSNKIISIKEYVLWHLANTMAVDISIASGTGLFNIHTKNWEKSIFDELKIDISKVNQTVAPSTIVGYITKECSNETGLKQGIPVIIGAGDGALSTLGSNCLDESKMTFMVATSGAVRKISKKPIIDSQRRTWCYILDEENWLPGSAINNAGIVMSWYVKNFYANMIDEKIDPYKLMEKWALEIAAGSEGLIFLPFLTGERGPYWNSNARGIIFGMALHHDRRHLARAIVEGVAFRMKSIYEALCDVAGKPEKIIATGGLMKSNLWAQICADVLGTSIHRTNVEEASSFGAAIMAMKGVGVIKNYDEILSKTVNIVESFKPIEENQKIYSKLYEIYKDIYTKLQEDFIFISHFQQGILP